MSGQPAQGRVLSCTKASAWQELWATAKAGTASCHAPKQARCRNFGQWRKLAPRLVMHQSEHTAASLVDAEDRRRAGCVPKQRRGGNLGQRRKLASRLAMHQSRRVAGTLGNGERQGRVLSCTKASAWRRVWLTSKIDAAPGVYQSNGAEEFRAILKRNNRSVHIVQPMAGSGLSPK